MTALVIAGLLLLAWIGTIVVIARMRPRDGWNRTSRHPKARRIALVVLLVAMPLTAGWVAWPQVNCLSGGVDSGITLQGGECVGVTDGTYHFSGDFADGEIGEDTKAAFGRIQDKIKEQNTFSGPHVKVALLAPLTSPLSGPRVVHELAGAAAAQRWINEPGRGAPRIQLLLAHMGSAEAQWEHVVDQLIDMTDDDEPLVAVVGMGLSQNETRDAAIKLSKAGVPMVADVVTATSLNEGNPIDKFHRVAYTNDQQFDALFQALRDKGVHLDNAVVIKSDDEQDTYSTTAAESVAGRLPRRPTPVEFGGSDPGKLGNQFREISRSLCGSRDAVVFYAGRSRYLSNMMQKLDAEGCLNSAVVVSASDAAVLRTKTNDDTVNRNWGLREAREVVRKGKVSLYFTPLADPRLLTGRPQYQDFQAAFGAVGAGSDDVHSGWAIMAWDALRVTAEWVWTAQATVEPDLPRAKDVSRASTLKFTGESYPFDGASGRFWFRDGNRLGSQPAVIQLTGDL
jgi:ABC-type branched-subunit amino acid transport system substrate-binding protein